MSNDLKRELAHVYWLGGSPCAGKSTVGEILAQRYDLRFYRVDEQYDEHFLRGVTSEFPTFSLLNRLEGDALWMRPVDEQIQTEISYCADEFTFIIEDLLALPTTKSILAEGTSLLPGHTVKLLNKKQRALWLIPTPEFQRYHYSQRPWIHSVLKSCTNPRQAFLNWMARDEGFARWVEKETKALWLTCIINDGRLTPQELAEKVARHFRL